MSTAPRIVGGLDRERGGTWMGATERGLFVGLTNQRTYRPPRPGLASRGEVVRRALTRDGVAEIDAFLGGLDPDDTDEFNLMYGDARELRVAYARRGAPAIEVHALGEGVHVLPNDSLGCVDFPKCCRAEARVGPLLHLPLDELLGAPARAEPAGAAPRRSARRWQFTGG